MLSDSVVLISSQKLSRSSIELETFVLISGVSNKSSISWVSDDLFFPTSSNKLSNDELSGTDGCVFDTSTVLGIIFSGELVYFCPCFLAENKELSTLISGSIPILEMVIFSGLVVLAVTDN